MARFSSVDLTRLHSGGVCTGVHRFVLTFFCVWGGAGGWSQLLKAVRG
jgi:hypothetical protein